MSSKKSKRWYIHLAIAWAFAAASTFVLHRQIDFPTDNDSEETAVKSPLVNATFIDEEEDSNFTARQRLNPPRFLMGIMSHDQTKFEKQRRQMIRKTYLSSFNDSTICSLKEVISSSFGKKCQLVFTFVHGISNKKAKLNRTTLLNQLNSDDILASFPHKEPDVIKLNIKENGKYGKSPTWFHYASLIVNEYNLTMDYVIKTDSDTLLLPKRFIRWVQQQEESRLLTERKRIYGGSAFTKKMCGWPEHEHCALLKAPIFMGGAFYFVSLDLAQYITSNDCPRHELFLPHEDVTMGNYVYSYQDFANQTIIAMAHKGAYLNTWKHPVKNPKRMLHLWRKYLQKQKKRQQEKEKKHHRKEAGKKG